MSYILVYYKPCSYELHSYRALFYIYGLTVTSYDNRHERDLCGKSGVLLQLSGTKFDVWRKLAMRYEKVYWQDYLEPISLLVLGHQLMYNTGQYWGIGIFW